MGGLIELTYGQAEPTRRDRGRDGTDYLPDGTGDCYRVDYNYNEETGQESWDRFYKQLAMKVVERDLVAGSPHVVTSYYYLDSPRWTNPVNFAQPDLAPDGSDWRGYSTVRTTRCSGDSIVGDDDATVADVFNAVATGRAYRPARSIEAALEVMSQESGAWVDPEMVAAFLSIADSRYDQVEWLFGARPARNDREKPM